MRATKPTCEATKAAVAAAAMKEGAGASSSTDADVNVDDERASLSFAATSFLDCLTKNLPSNSTIGENRAVSLHCGTKNGKAADEENATGGGFDSPTAIDAVFDSSETAHPFFRGHEATASQSPGLIPHNEITLIPSRSGEARVAVVVVADDEEEEEDTRARPQEHERATEARRAAALARGMTCGGIDVGGTTAAATAALQRKRREKKERRGIVDERG